MKMTFFHGTTNELWDKIQKEGVLFGIRNSFSNFTPDRCTYLAIDIEEAKMYGDIVLKVDYDTKLHPEMNNYIEGCWQFRVYEPISLNNIEKIPSQKY